MSDIMLAAVIFVIMYIEDSPRFDRESGTSKLTTPIF